MITQTPPTHYRAKLLASNDHVELEFHISEWLRTEKPKRILDANFVADGAEYSYCVLFLYEPRTVPLPKYRKRDS